MNKNQLIFTTHWDQNFSSQILVGVMDIFLEIVDDLVCGIAIILCLSLVANGVEVGEGLARVVLNQ